MKISRLIPVVLIPLLFACLPKKPEIPLTEVPSGPLFQMLDQRRQSFTGLKAVASVEAVRSGHKRSYDTVGIMVDDQRRFRVEAYGPLGQSLMTLVWDGTDVALRLEDGRIVRPGPAGLEKIIGVAIDAGDLCSVLSANVPAAVQPVETRAFLKPDGSFLIELSRGDTLRRVHAQLSESDPDRTLRITAIELFRSGKLIYRALYEQMEQISHYLIPKTIRIENPERKISLTIVYDETDVNVPLNDDAFRLPDAEAPWQ
ncbi:MAG TPA: hypothetical protein VL087_02475 [Nitrospirota bacterium]|nr:hypothetical protein [Nitrospirota bacterium]